ncbi:MAG TPA: hypothetical protein P5120_08800 [Spirochaetota bacterium]|nr:hypothetical protein [Spirochaetota bacterium]HRX47605.1 hypothetical protein [Spirochaetota bacterium]
MYSGKWILFAGIVLLLSGGAARGAGSGIAPFLFSAGGICKISYILLSVKTGRYRPGYEIIFLVTGLLLLFCGIAARRYAAVSVYSLPLISFAVSLKIIFVVFFVKKFRRGRSSY